MYMIIQTFSIIKISHTKLSFLLGGNLWNKMSNKISTSSAWIILVDAYVEVRTLRTLTFEVCNKDCDLKSEQTQIL